MRKSALNWRLAPPLPVPADPRLERIWRSGVNAAQPAEIIRQHGRLDGQAWILGQGPTQLVVALPRSPGRVFIAGAGKAVVPFAAALARSLGEHLAAGLVVTRTGHGLGMDDPRIDVIEAAHPVPDARSEAAARRLEAFLGGLTQDDVLFFLVTGGASALLAAPAADVSLADKQAITRLLLERGADIHAINCVRRHLSRLKGGGVLRQSRGARVVTLAVSDVIGDLPESIGSGMTTADPTTYADACRVAERFRLDRDGPATVVHHLHEGAAGRRKETLKRGDPMLGRSTFHVLASLDQSLVAAAGAGAVEGFDVLRLGSHLQGPVESCAETLLAAIRSAQGTCAGDWLIVCGGEPEVEVRGPGQGGRNQHLALLLACGTAGFAGVHGLVAGTDGTDGSTPAAGAWFSADTLSRGSAVGLDADAALRRFDSASYFAALGDQFITGPTGTNVMDLILVAGPGKGSTRAGTTGRF